MDAYGAAKARLFAWPALKTAVINAEDAFGQQLITACRGRGQSVLTYGRYMGDITTRNLGLGINGIAASVVTPWGKAELAQRPARGRSTSSCWACSVCCWPATCRWTWR